MKAAKDKEKYEREGKENFLTQRLRTRGRWREGFGKAEWIRAHY